MAHTVLGCVSTRELVISCSGAEAHANWLSLARVRKHTRTGYHLLGCVSTRGRPIPYYAYGRGRLVLDPRCVSTRWILAHGAEAHDELSRARKHTRGGRTSRERRRKPGCASTTERPEKRQRKTERLNYGRPAGTSIEDYGQWGNDSPLHAPRALG